MISSWSCCFPSGRPFPSCGYILAWAQCRWHRNFPSRFGKFLSEASGPRALVQVQAQLQRLASWSFSSSQWSISWPIGFPPKHPWSYKKCPVSTRGFVVWCDKKTPKSKKQPSKSMDDPGPEEWTQGNPFRSSWQVVKLFVDKLSTKIPKSGVPIHYSILTQWTWIHSPCSADCFSGIFLFWKKSPPSKTPDFEKNLPDERNLVDVILESYETVVKAMPH